MRQWLVVAGPGYRAYDAEDSARTLQGLAHNGADVWVAGNGIDPLEVSEITDTVKVMSNAGERISLFVMAHGYEHEGEHRLDFGSGKQLPTGQFFEQIAHASNGVAVDIFMISCHGAAALSDINVLPTGSQLAVLAPSDETASYYDTARLVEQLNTDTKKDISVAGLLDLYLSASLANRISPNFGVSGHGYANLEQKFQERCGKLFSAKDRIAAKEALGAIVDEETIDRVMDTIASARTAGNVLAEDYGLALAICNACCPELRPVPQVFDKKIFRRSFDREQSTDHMLHDLNRFLGTSEHRVR